MAKKKTHSRLHTHHNPMILVGVFVGILLALGWVLYMNKLSQYYQPDTAPLMEQNY